ncbi:PTS mannitol transporter subunit IICBA [Nocardioides astragali]|uniref:Mannitol-specific phosphotransferase enzyme IIA component n=1 Tax=Nocardioides astragali TaxID=1776736 RepID=A0ABW2N7G3_9ACTN|nr:PTS mannitol transporter subunit IICBA [Nocardioides astragali]
MATTTTSTPPAERGGARIRVQKFGTFLSNMVMPNIGAFIAWGFITALFIEVGWLPYFGFDDPGGWVAQVGGWGEFAAPEGSPIGNGLVSPMIMFLLPLLIAYTGGYNIYDKRGGVVGAIATMGVIAGTDIPMFMGAMIMGPLGGWSMKKIDAIWDGKIRPGFEMLVNNFSAGIWGMLLTVFAFFVMSPIVTWIADRLGEAVDFLVTNNLLPFTAVIIEPAKVLFLNNALNHGVLTPLGGAEVQEAGKSVLFLLEANPASGLGLLLAYMFFGKGMAKASAPGAAIIHFFGGIHEIYFPYVLMKPKLILAMIAGGMTQIFVNVIFNTGLVSPAAPGSIFAVYAQTARGSYVGVTLSVILGAAASFIVAAILLKTDRTEEDEEGDLAAATASMESMKGKKSIASSALGGAAGRDIKNIVFACDAGMGSSAMGASVLRKKIQQAGHHDVTVVNKAISNLRDDVDLVVTHQDLTDRARQKTPSAMHVSVDNFMGSPRYDEIVEMLGSSSGGAAVADEPAVAAANVLSPDSIVLGGSARTRDEAIAEAGQLLVAAGAVDASYVEAMHEREKSVSTLMGNGLAIPHGTNEAKGAINRSALSFVRYDESIDWNGKPAEFVVGIAGAGDDHLALLRSLATVFADESQVARLRAATTADEVLAVLDGVAV